MEKKDMSRVEGYFEAFLIVSLFLLFFYLIKGFILPLLMAATLVFLFYEQYKLLSVKFKSENLAAFAILMFVIVVILVPVFFFSVGLVNQTKVLIDDGGQIFSGIDLKGCGFSFCNTISDKLDFTVNIDLIITKLGEKLSNSFSGIFSSITKLFVNFFIFVLAFFFLLKDGDKFIVYVKKIIPMKSSYKEALFFRFREVTLAVFVDSILVAILQGFLLGFGFWIFGISSPIFWGTVAAFFALIPMIGTAIIWVPVVIYFFLTKEILIGSLLLAYGTIIVGLSDNVIRPILIKRKISVHSFLILISILGGLEVFGFLGIFLGPIIVSLLISVLELYKLDFK